LRRTAVSGQFYPGIPKYLKRELKRCFTNITGGVRDVTGAVVPHAGYLYAALPEADTYVLLGPNHTGLGSVVAVSRETWNTPLGDVPANKELVKQLLGGMIDLDLDESAHQYEHSIEVQLPFLQYRFSHEFNIVPICMGLQDQETATEVGDQLAQAIKDSDNRIVIIASSDFSHYVEDSVAKETDNYLIEPVLELDVDGFRPHLGNAYGIQSTGCFKRYLARLYYQW